MTRHEPRVCPRHGTPLSSDGYCDECGGPAPDEEEAREAETSTDASLDYESGDSGDSS
jgi:hypothetical protein